jgi:hypothetical protein
MHWSSFSFKREAMWMMLFPFISALLGVLILLVVLFLRWTRTA